MSIFRLVKSNATVVTRLSSDALNVKMLCKCLALNKLVVNVGVWIELVRCYKGTRESKFYGEKLKCFSKTVSNFFKRDIRFFVEGLDTFILARHKQMVRSVRALSHVLGPHFLDVVRIYNTILSTSRLLAPSSG